MIQWLLVLLFGASSAAVSTTITAVDVVEDYTPSVSVTDISPYVYASELLGASVVEDYSPDVTVVETRVIPLVSDYTPAVRVDADQNGAFEP